MHRGYVVQEMIVVHNGEAGRHQSDGACACVGGNKVDFLEETTSDKSLRISVKEGLNEEPPFGHATRLGSQESRLETR